MMPDKVDAYPRKQQSHPVIIVSFLPLPGFLSPTEIFYVIFFFRPVRAPVTSD